MTETAVGGLRFRPFRIRRELWGLLDQALVSGVNFLTIILVARTLVPREFGYFVLAFTVLQTAGTLQSALLTRPHNVLAAVRRDRAYADYSTTSAAAQAGLAVVLALVAALVAAGLWAVGSPHALLALALVPALLAWQLQEFGRRVLYTEGRLRAAFANDLLGYGCQAAALVALWRLDRLTAPAALLTLAAAFAVASAVLGRQLRPSLSGRLEGRSLAATWSFGKWLGLAEVGQWLSTHLYIYLGAAIIGSVASAALKAGQTLLGPMSVFLTFVTSYLPVLYARDLDATGSIAPRTRRSLRAILPMVLVYCGAVAVFARPLLETVYGDAYGEYVVVVRLFALYYVLLALSTVAIAALSARSATRAVFAGQAAGAALSVAIGWLLLRELGPEGGVVGMLLSWGLTMAWLLNALRRGR